MLIDLHTHTFPKSADSGLSLEVLLTTGRRKGLDGVCLTEHNSVWGRGDVTGLAERYGISVFRGMEVSTDIGHVLVFGIERYTTEMSEVYRLAHIVEEEDGAMILAHPWREDNGVPGWPDVSELFDAVEVINGCDSKVSSAYWVYMVSAMGICTTAGSDAHSAGAIGSCATEFETAVKDDAELVRAIKSCKYRPVWLDGPYL